MKTRISGRLMVFCISAAMLLAAGCVATQPGSKSAASEAEARRLETERRLKAEAEAKRLAAEEAVKKAAEEAVKKAAEEAKKAEAEARRLAEEKALQARTFAPIYFDYDMYNIRADQRPVLAGHVERLKASPDFKLTLEGHCDERGTVEYNLALGQKRVDSVKGFLTKAGIASGRLQTVSYGKERPVDLGHSEQAWARNRRTELVMTEPAR